jgi:hypothetical protein
MTDTPAIQRAWVVVRREKRADVLVLRSFDVEPLPPFDGSRFARIVDEAMGFI